MEQRHQSRLGERDAATRTGTVRWLMGPSGPKAAYERGQKRAGRQIWDSYDLCSSGLKGISSCRLLSHTNARGASLNRPGWARAGVPCIRTA